MGDVDKAANEIARQFEVFASAPLPFLILLAIVSAGIWRAFVWRYGGKIERLENDKQWLVETLERRKEESVAHLPSRNAVSAGEVATIATVPSAPENLERQFIEPEWSLEKLTDFLTRAESIANDRYIASFVGKWARFEREVESTALISGEVIVRLASLDESSLRQSIVGSISAYFLEATPQIEALQPGDVVSGMGLIQHLGRTGTILINCELE